MPARLHRVWARLSHLSLLKYLNLRRAHQPIYPRPYLNSYCYHKSLRVGNPTQAMASEIVWSATQGQTAASLRSITADIQIRLITRMCNGSGGTAIPNMGPATNIHYDNITSGNGCPRPQRRRHRLSERSSFHAALVSSSHARLFGRKDFEQRIIQVGEVKAEV